MNVTYMAQIRRVSNGQTGMWFDEALLPDGEEGGRMRMEELRRDPELAAGYEIRAVKRTEEVVDL